MLRYDKRAVGQSGGRAEGATLSDYAEDVRGAVRFLSERKDIDNRRIIVLGHGDGGSIALLAASREKRIAGVVLAGTPGMSGEQLVMAQQERTLGRMKITDAEKQQKVELQQKINQAVLTGKGWESLPLYVRRQVDTPEYQSILSFDPAKAMTDVQQPVLILHAELDAQVGAANAERLETLGKARKRTPPTEVQRVPGVNHLFVPATTGEVSEYPSLKGKTVAPAASSAVAAWVQKTLPPRK